MSERKNRNVVDWTIQIEEALMADMYMLADRYAKPVDEVVSYNLYNGVISVQMSGRRAEGVYPASEYQPPQTLADDETPPAFFVPFGPIPAMYHYHESVPDVYWEEQSPADDEKPPTIELLPDSNPGAYWTHIVAPGETLSGIAARYYGDASQYVRIAQASNIYQPFIIYVGQTLTVPKPELSEGQVLSFSSSCDAWRSHIVKPGDTLSNIAAQYYGSSGDYWRIANCNNIQPPNYVIYVGDNLAIPSRQV
jgi:nucleoid-associated protein YgaU